MGQPCHTNDWLRRSVVTVTGANRCSQRHSTSGLRVDGADDPVCEADPTGYLQGPNGEGKVGAS